MGFVFIFFLCHKFARLLQRVMIIRVTHVGFDFSVRNFKIINLYSFF